MEFHLQSFAKNKKSSSFLQKIKHIGNTWFWKKCKVVVGRDLESNHGVSINIMPLRDELHGGEPGSGAAALLRLHTAEEGDRWMWGWSPNRKLKQRETITGWSPPQDLLTLHLLESVFSELLSFVFSSSFTSMDGSRNVRRFRFHPASFLPICPVTNQLSSPLPPSFPPPGGAACLPSCGWPRSSVLPPLRPLNRRTPPRRLSSYPWPELWTHSNTLMQQRGRGRSREVCGGREVRAVLLDRRLSGSSLSSSSGSSGTASSGMACIWTPGAWGSIRRFSNRRCLNTHTDRQSDSQEAFKQLLHHTKTNRLVSVQLKNG